MAFSKDFPNFEVLPVAKVESIGIRYPELHKFIQEIDSYDTTKIHHPYYAHKGPTSVYRLIFVFFGFIFFLLGAIIYFKQPNWICNRILWDCNLVKYVAMSLSFLLSFSAIVATFRLKIEKEAANFLMSKAKLELSQKYKRKSSHFSLLESLPFNPHPERNLVRHSYEESLERMNRANEDCLVMMKRIVLSSNLSRRAKEQLLDQSLLKLKDIIEGIVAKFDRTQDIANASN